MEWFANFFQSNSVWVYVLIFFAKLIEVSMMTVRLILVNRGMRTLGAIISFVEVLLWVFVVAGVLTSFTSSPLKGVMYAAGFANGVWVGGIIEEKIALGKSVLQIIIPVEKSASVSKAIRDLGVGVTEVAAKGHKSEKEILIVFLERKTSKKVIEVTRAIAPDAVISSNEATTIYGGYLPARKKFILRK
jgi:uncharacterized protein YebE (UPF0316 family)